TTRAAPRSPRRPRPRTRRAECPRACRRRSRSRDSARRRTESGRTRPAARPAATSRLQRPSYHQLVAGPVDRDDVARLGRVFLDLLAQLHHEVVDAACARVARHAPDLLEDLLTRDRLSGPFPEQAQELDLVERE